MAMDPKYKGLYHDLILLVHKSDSDDVIRFQHYLESKMDQVEGITYDEVAQLLKEIRARFRKNVSVDDLINASDDDLRKAVEAAFDIPIAQRIVQALSPIVDDTLNFYKDEYGVKAAWDVINTGAIDALKDQVGNVFSTLSDSMAQQVLDAIAEAKSDKHTLRHVIDNVRSTFGEDIPVYDADGNLIRTIPNDQWARTVARTEGTRAAALSQKSLFNDLGLQKFQFVAESTACDNCAEMDGNVYDVDEIDSLIPQHANCRCIAMAILQELVSATEGES